MHTKGARLPSDTDTEPDVYWINRGSGVITLVSGSVGDGYYGNTAANVTGDGDKIVFSMTGSAGVLGTYDVSAGSSTLVPWGGYPLRIDDLSGDASVASIWGRFCPLIDTATGISTWDYGLLGHQYLTPTGSLDDSGHLHACNRRWLTMLGLYNDYDPRADALVMDTTTWTAKNVSRTTSGAAPNGSVGSTVLSDDGHWLVYWTTSSNTTATSTMAGGIYLVDLTKV